MAKGLVEISKKPINSELLKNSAVGPMIGAIVEFHGLVRNHDGGREVARLEYESHESALSVLEQIAGEIERQFPQVHFAVSHRIGALEIGDLAFYVVAAAAHREQAFEVCRLLVEEVKEKIPVWKNQIFTDGSNEWVNSA